MKELPKLNILLMFDKGKDLMMHELCFLSLQKKAKMDNGE
jgi:hypothetical protein